MLNTVEKEGEDMARKLLAQQGANKRLKEKLEAIDTDANDLRRTGTPRPNCDPIFEVMPLLYPKHSEPSSTYMSLQKDLKCGCGFCTNSNAKGVPEMVNLNPKVISFSTLRLLNAKM